MDPILIIIIVIIVVILLWLLFVPTNTSEHMSQASIIQNVAGLYNTGQATVSNIRVNDNLYAGISNQLLPGSIAIFYGSTAPSGWTICDGTNGTPDLRNRFVLGADPLEITCQVNKNKQVGCSGGEEAVKLTIDQIPAHNHNYEKLVPNNIETVGNPPAATNSLFVRPFSFPSASTNATGANQAHNNMHPYYVLIYIMKL